jgi:hypothetical protein
MSVFSDPNYVESKLLPFEGTPGTEWIEQYDYESDSDLGYSSDEERSEKPSAGAESLTTGKYANNFQHLH